MKGRQMKPQFENVIIPQNCSIRVLNRRVPEIPFEWHHHPEYELTLTLNSRGFRFIGDHIGAYGNHDLALIPPEMPHTWESSAALDETSPHIAIVIWFTEHWALQLADTFPEYSSVSKLIKRATRGLSFPSSAGEMMESRLSGLLSNSPRDRLRSALDVLSELAETGGVSLATPLTESGIAVDESAQLKRVLAVLHARFAESIRIRDLCEIGNVSERSLHRLFVRHLGENLTDYLGRLRIGRACTWLAETDRPISVIASDAGFANLSNFNRRFRAARNMSPKEFRRYYIGHGSIAGRDEFELTKRSPSLEGSKHPKFKLLLSAH
jgi:AraC-like DNA-binding protein